MPSVDQDITQAVRDTVIVESRRMGRSQTSNPSAPRSPAAVTRSQSQDSVPSPEKKSKSKSKKGSQHADVIDRLDFTGVGPMFHHDGPFDACAPSRNRQKSKAPMMAWTPRPDDQPEHPNPPTPQAYKAYNDYDAPKKKVDAIAEAWGIHEPEPFEEFFAGGGTRGDTPSSSIYNGHDSHNRRSNKDSRESSGASRPRHVRRSVVPPPKPIFISEPESETAEFGSTTPPSNANGFPKRNKSIMHRIRKMRDAPNVPVGSDYDEPASPSQAEMNSSSPRPTHRPQNSFLGRFGNAPRSDGQATTEPFVLIDATTNKNLPATPGTQDPQTYFDGESAPGHPVSPGGGIGRKAILMKKMGRVVRGTR